MLPRDHFNRYFPKYKGPPWDADAMCQFIAEQFLALSGGKNRNVTVFFSNATDTDQFESLWPRETFSKVQASSFIEQRTTNFDGGPVPRNVVANMLDTKSLTKSSNFDFDFGFEKEVSKNWLR